MSSAAYINFEDEAGIPRDRWLEFCAEHDIFHRPQTVGGNVLYAGAVEIVFGDANYDDPPELPSGRLDFDAVKLPEHASSVTFSTFYGGSAMPEVAALAKACWQRFGGMLEAAPELRPLF